jgi:hypothetical protein
MVLTQTLSPRRDERTDKLAQFGNWMVYQKCDAEKEACVLTMFCLHMLLSQQVRAPSFVR